jgi:hypothetical protein
MSGSGKILAHRSAKDNGKPKGTVQVYEFQNELWVKKGSLLRGESENEIDRFGYSISLSYSGDTIVISDIIKLGKVYIYAFDNGEWHLIGNINGDEKDKGLGSQVRLSNDGRRLIVGAIENDENGLLAGALSLYRYEENQWTMIADKIYGEENNTKVGWEIDISATGNTIVYSSGDYHHDEVKVFVKEVVGNQITPLGNALYFNSYSYYSTKVCISGEGNAITILEQQDINGIYKLHYFELLDNTWEPKGETLDINMGNAMGQSIRMAMSNSGEVLAITYDNPDKVITKIFKFKNNGWTEIGEIIFNNDSLNNQCQLSDDGKYLSISYSFGNGSAVVYSIEDLLSDKSLIDTTSPSIYPNPASALLYITENELVKSYSILDINGRIVAYKVENASTIDVSALLPAVYQLILYGSDGQILNVERFLKY